MLVIIDHYHQLLPMQPGKKEMRRYHFNILYIFCVNMELYLSLHLMSWIMFSLHELNQYIYLCTIILAISPGYLRFQIVYIFNSTKPTSWKYYVSVMFMDLCVV